WVSKPLDSSLEEGKPGYLHCYAQASPQPEVSWYRSGMEITPEDSRFKLFPNGTLRINNVEVYDAHMYGCDTRTIGGRLSGQARVTVLEKLKFTPTPQPSQCLELDKEITIQCSAKGRESPTIRWTKADGGELPPHVDQRNGQLRFTKVTRSDAGNYTCIASNSLQGEIRALVTLTVAVYIRFKVEPDNTTVYQGHTAVLHCQASGDPEPHIHWMVKDKALDITKNGRIQKMPNGSLIIRDVTTDDTGRYTCVVGNSCSIKDRVAQLYVQNGHTTAEIQEEVALTTMGTVATTEKRHSHASDKLHFPRANLQTITTLGKGEFGEVLLSKAKGIEENEAELVVLVKSLQSRDEQLQSDFRREAEMFAKLSHPNVVRLLGLCREADPHYMILEYYDLVSICAQVAHGMEHLSNHRFVHKDLAARNCLISSQRRIKVSSLSLSKDVYNSEYYHYRQAWIPLRWLPTESVFEDDYSTKSDVWAFGVLMWEVFSLGEMPHSKLSDDDVLEGLKMGKLKLPAPDGCPSKIYKLMVRCWAPGLKERPSFTDIVHALGDQPPDSKV
ncbi:hypothetical protein GOODEAATRI_014416, partial [Goodea atripinnis]